MGKWDWKKGLSGAGGAYLSGGNPLISLGTGVGTGFMGDKYGSLEAGMLGLGVGGLGGKFGLNEAVGAGMKGMGFESPALTQSTWSPEFMMPMTNKLWGTGGGADTGARIGTPNTGGIQPSGAVSTNPLSSLSGGDPNLLGFNRTEPPSLESGGARGNLDFLNPQQNPSGSLGMMRDFSLTDFIGAGSLGYGVSQAMNPQIPEAWNEQINDLENSGMPEEYLDSMKAALNIQKEEAFNDYATQLNKRLGSSGWGAGGSYNEEALADYHRNLTNDATVQYLASYDEMLRQQNQLKLQAWMAKQKALESAANPWLELGGNWLGSRQNPMQQILSSGGNQGGSTNALSSLFSG